MMSESKIREQTYSYFLTEAQDLLQTIEQTLLTLKSDRSPAKVHDLMRSAHTLKGAAASVGFNSMKAIAHSLEDIFKALYKPEVAIDAELEALLFEGYECLRQPLTAAMAGTTCPEAELLDRAETIFKRIRSKLGNHFDPGAAIPSSTELGFDITQSLFESGVRERLEQLAIALESGNPTTISETLHTQAEVFIGLAESLNLPGFGEIAKTAIAALQKQPDLVLEIAQAALADFRQGQIAVLGGDRTLGGQVSETLQHLAGKGKRIAQGKRDRTSWTAQAPKKVWHRLKRIFDRPAPIIETPQVAPEPSISTPLPSFDAFELDALSEFADSFEPVASESSSTSTTVGFELWDEGSEETIAPTETIPLIVEPMEAQIERVAIEKPIPMKAETPEVQPLQPLTTSTVRVELEHLDSVNHITSELLIHQNQQTLQDERMQMLLNELLEQLKHHQQVLAQLRDWSDGSFVGSEKLKTSDADLKAKFDVLELDRYSDLHLLLQSALEDAGRLETEAEAIEFLARESRLARSKQGRLLGNLRDDLMTVRMIPIATVLNRFPAVVQQLMETYGKRVELRLVGTQVLVDKALADKLYDPLLHLIRNAFDHGIELAEARRKQGKSDVGCIEIRAYQQGNRTLIEVRDDGRGLDLQRICQRGFEMNLLPSNRIEQFSPMEIMDLMFEPGFSTAEQVTDLSGRGVGLDVVRSQMHSLHGNITVTSEPNQGTTFSLQLPLTLMTARLLVCQAGQMVYGLLSDEVDRILSASSGQIETVRDKQILHTQQDGEECAIPVHNLSESVPYTTWVARAAEAVQHEEALTPVPMLSSPILLLHRSQGQIGLQVDRILGEQELVIRPISNAIAAPDYVYGCSILGDGRLLLVIDGLALIGKPTTRSETPEVTPTRAQPTTQEPTQTLTPVIPPQIAPIQSVSSRRKVLVIDDSMTLRQALTLTFEDGGYDVVQAQDGLDAIEKLKQHADVQLITCDVEMPRLNGFEFLMRYRQESALPQAPVVMLTSRTNEKHQELAMQLGASAYITKPFVERSLLQTVEQYLSKKVTR